MDKNSGVKVIFVTSGVSLVRGYAVQSGSGKGRRRVVVFRTEYFWCQPRRGICREGVTTCCLRICVAGLLGEAEAAVKLAPLLRTGL